MLIFNNKKCVEPNVDYAIQAAIKTAVMSVLGTHKAKISPLENTKQNYCLDRQQQAA